MSLNVTLIFPLIILPTSFDLSDFCICKTISKGIFLENLCIPNSESKVLFLSITIKFMSFRFFTNSYSVFPIIHVISQSIIDF